MACKLPGYITYKDNVKVASLSGGQLAIGILRGIKTRDQENILQTDAYAHFCS